MDHWKLIKKKLKGTLSEKQHQQLESWLKEDPANLERFQELEANWNLSDNDEFNAKPAFKKLKKRIKKGELDTQQATKRIRWAVAASFALIVSVSLVFFLNQPKPEINYITKSTTRGQKATITLSDGSVVKLNAESSITYPENFAEVATRDITLTGEAFFEVKRDEAKPFTIQTEGLLTTVLGTSFNITAFPEMDEIEVTVATGRVSVSSTKGDSSLQRGAGDVSQKLKAKSRTELVEVLTPGQQATYHKTSHKLSMREVDTERYLAWKDGVIYMANEKYKQVFDKLARWYGVEFEFANVPTEEWDYTGEFKDMSLELVLETIGYASGFEFQILEDKVIIEFEK